MWERKKELALKNKGLEEEIEQKRLEAKEVLTDHQIDIQKALVELYDKQLDLRKKQIDLIDYVAEKAPKIVEQLYPDADLNIKAMATNALVKDLFQLSESKGLELSLPAPIQNEKEPTTGDI